MVFFLIISAILVGNVALWRWTDKRLKGWLRVAVGVFFALQFCYMATLLVAPEFARRSHQFLPTPVTAAAYLWHLLVMPAALGTVAVWSIFRIPFKAEVESRRSFLGACAAVAPPILTGVGVGISLPFVEDFRIRRLHLPIPGLPAGLEGTTIAHVSDLHVGKFSSEDSLGRVVDAVNGLRADLVLLTGDLIDLSLADLPQAIEAVRALDPRQGLFLCEGNHDLIDDPEEFRRRAKQARLPLLLDEAETVEVNGESVQILGSRWRRKGLGGIERLRDPAAFPILLAHHPHLFDDAQGFPLTLAGHTHGGQLMINERLGAGPVLFRYWTGESRSKAK